MPSSILLVSDDPKLPAEFQAAIGGLPFKDDLVVHTAADLRQGAEAARNRRPAAIIVEMTRDLPALKAFADEVSSGTPESLVAAVFHPSIFGHDVSESAVLIEALRAGIRDFLRRPLSAGDVEQLLGRLSRKPSAEPKSAAKVIAFASNKGGVGKTTMAVNIACDLAQRRPGKVLLIDASLQLGVCSTMLDLRPQSTLSDAVRQRQRLDETLLKQLVTRHSSGLELLAAPHDAVEANEVDDENLSRVLTMARRCYDVVIVDSFPLIDRVMMAVLDLSDRVYLVMESTVPTILGGAKLCQLMDGLSVPRAKQRILLNRHVRDAGNLPPTDVAARLGRPVDVIVPYEKKLFLAANLGQPLILRTGRWFSRFGKVMHELTDELDAWIGKPASPSRNGKHP
ncbi:MAG: AAA family ATPase [Gemmataceae bacterium]